MKMSLTASTLVSTLLHASAVGALLWGVQPAAAPPIQHSPLAVELYGMIANRQTAQRAATQAAPEPAPQQAPQQPPQQPPPEPPPPQPKPKPKPKPKAKSAPPAKPRPPAPAQTQTLPSPVKVADEEPEPIAQAASTPPESAPPSAPETRSAQEQQRLAKAAEEAAFKQYLSRLSKKVQAHLVYPDAVKKTGHEGIATVSFVLTTSGHILPGSLHIARTSDSDVLDASALQALRDAEPFEPPPRQFQLSIGISFSQAQRVR